MEFVLGMLFLAALVGGALAREGLDARDILTITGPDGERFGFHTVRNARRGRHGLG